MNASHCFIDGFGPVPLVRPDTVAEVGEWIRQSAASDNAVYPLGGQTKLALGMTPSKNGQAIDLRGLNRIIDFPARDMTVTVQAGITMQALQEILSPENLRLPIDVAQSSQATLGGILATNTSGPRRYGYGTLRDYVIGISALNNDGKEYKAGGRVVKNVAGYDLCKLLIGSLGTLGIITQVTLKLRPLSEEQVLISLGVDTADLESLLNKLHLTRTRPVCLDLLNFTAAQAVYSGIRLTAPATAWTLLIGYEGNADAVNWQVQQLVKEVGLRDQLNARVGFTAQPLWNSLIEWGTVTEATSVFKANVLPGSVAAFCQAMDGMLPRPQLRAHAGNGIIFGSWTDALTKHEAAHMLTLWRQHAQHGLGQVIVLRCPSAWKSTLSVWGPPTGDAWLMRTVKDNFDPKRIFNPGRFIDGI